MQAMSRVAQTERTPLGLAEALILLQLSSGELKITAFLLAAAGASETGPALAMVGSEDDEEALGALLVLKAERSGQAAPCRTKVSAQSQRHYLELFFACMRGVSTNRSQSKGSIA
ncbi:AG118 [Symbiodinium sp. CCMP2592]|nr:AG118 [Symbiodinium sp. CCMP2592]